MKKNMIGSDFFDRIPSFCRPGYFWMVSKKISAENIVPPLAEMAKAGAAAVCPHPLPPGFRPDAPSTLSPEYLSEEYFKAFVSVLESCEKLGMSPYIYDEGGWPSGSGCGRVLAADPEHFTRQYVISDGKGGYEIRREENHPEVWAPIPNILRPGVTEKFIELTHEGYARHLSRFFGKVCRYFFTDEPAYYITRGRLPWTDDFGAEFRKRKGYAIEPLLGKILEVDRFKIPENQARIDYFDVLSQLFVERYLTPIRDWCRAHNMESGGHFGGEDETENMANCGYGHILRSLRGLDLPGIDVIWRQLYPGARRHTFPKYPSSVAHQQGKKFALGEIFAIYGGGLTPQVMHWLLDYLLVRGVNLIVISSFNYRLEKAGMAGRGFGPHSPLWKYMHIFHDYAGRAAWLLSQGTPVISTALFFDAHSLWSGGFMARNAATIQENAAEKLSERRCDFDFVDDDALNSGTICGRKWRVGEMTYDRLIVPRRAMMEERTRQKIASFRAAGGCVLAEDELLAVPPMLQAFPETDALRVHKRKLRGGVVYFVVNESLHPVSVTLTAPEKLPVVRCDLETGRKERVRSRCGSWKWKFAPADSACFLLGEEEAAPAPAPLRNRCALEGSWKLAPVLQHRVGAKTYEYVTPQSPARSVKLGDWRGVLGENFSGDALYTLDFNCPDPAAWRELDLGQVCYSVSVTLNGVALGEKLWGPFRFALQDALQKGRNRLEIKVTNTLANEVYQEKVRKQLEEKWPPLSRYDPIMRSFEGESLESGLFGPVVLKG